MSSLSSISSLVDALDAIERVERRFAEQEHTLRQKLKEEELSADRRNRSAIDDTLRLRNSFEKIRLAVASELRKVGLDPLSISSQPPVEEPMNPRLEDLSGILNQATNHARALESSLNELERHREIRTRATQTVQDLKSRPPSPATPRLITLPPPSVPQPTRAFRPASAPQSARASQPASAPQPAKPDQNLTVFIVAGVGLLVIAVLSYYIFTQ